MDFVWKTNASLGLIPFNSPMGVQQLKECSWQQCRGLQLSQVTAELGRAFAFSTRPCPRLPQPIPALLKDIYLLLQELRSEINPRTTYGKCPSSVRAEPCVVGGEGFCRCGALAGDQRAISAVSSYFVLPFVPQAQGWANPPWIQQSQVSREREGLGSEAAGVTSAVTLS